MINVHVLSFHGELDIARKSHIEQELDRINLCGPEPVAILDLTDVPYLDSTFLNALARAEHHKVSGARICIVANKRIGRMFEITAFDRVFSVFNDVFSARRFAEATAYTMPVWQQG
ncbi:MAG TPA: STAS domain-containing protein [Verrucomicrobiae bacterium]|jgi:anti-anti-sigma factor|nr:STAS domain-containing protein [Verrucomicrobiae bacterium]